MTTTKSFSDSSRFSYLYRSELKQSLGLNLEIGLVVFLVFPLQYILSVVSFCNNPRRWELLGEAEIYNVLSIIAVPLIMTILPILVAAVVFKYMHNKRAADVYHALPVKRSKLFLSKYFAGLTMILLPIVFSYLVICCTALIFKAVDIQPLTSEYVSAAEIIERAKEISFLAILNDMAVWAVTSAAIYTISVFAAVNAGTIFDQLLYTLGLTFFPVGIAALLTFTFSQFLYGFVLPDNLLYRLIELCPVSLAWCWCFGGASEMGLLRFDLALGVWLLLTAVICIAAVIAYKYRRSERAGTVSKHNFVRELLKYAAVFLASQIVGFIFMAVFDSDGGLMYYLGTLIGAAACYIITETVMTRKFSSILKQTPMILASVVLCVGFSWAMTQGGWGYCVRVPDAEQVQSVEISYFGRYRSDSMQALNSEKTVTLQSQECTELILKAHQIIVDDYSENAEFGETSYDPTQDVDYNICPLIRYHLKNGTVLAREYERIPITAAEEFIKLNDCEEFIQKTHPVFLAEPEEIGKMTLMNALFLDGQEIQDEADRKELLEAVKKDLSAQKLSTELEQPAKTKAYLSFEITKKTKTGVSSRKDGTVEITERFENTLAVLRRQGLLNAVTVDPKKLEAAYIYYYGYYFSNAAPFYYSVSPDSDDLFLKGLTEKEVLEELDNSSTGIVKDPQKVQELFEKGRRLLKWKPDTGVEGLSNCFFVYDGQVSRVPELIFGKIEELLPQE